MKKPLFWPRLSAFWLIGLVHSTLVLALPLGRSHTPSAAESSCQKLLVMGERTKFDYRIDTDGFQIVEAGARLNPDYLKSVYNFLSQNDSHYLRFYNQHNRFYLGGSSTYMIPSADEVLEPFYQNIEAFVKRVHHLLRSENLYALTSQVRWFNNETPALDFHTDGTYLRFVITFMGPGTQVKTPSGRVVKVDAGEGVLLTGCYRHFVLGRQVPMTVHAAPAADGKRLLAVIDFSPQAFKQLELPPALPEKKPSFRNFFNLRLLTALLSHEK